MTDPIETIAAAAWDHSALTACRPSVQRLSGTDADRLLRKLSSRFGQDVLRHRLSSAVLCASWLEGDAAKYITQRGTLRLVVRKAFGFWRRDGRSNPFDPKDRWRNLRHYQRVLPTMLSLGVSLPLSDVLGDMPITSVVSKKRVAWPELPLADALMECVRMWADQIFRRPVPPEKRFVSYLRSLGPSTLEAQGSAALHTFSYALDYLGHRPDIVQELRSLVKSAESFADASRSLVTLITWHVLRHQPGGLPDELVSAWPGLFDQWRNDLRVRRQVARLAYHGSSLGDAGDETSSEPLDRLQVAARSTSDNGWYEDVELYSAARWVKRQRQPVPSVIVQKLCDDLSKASKEDGLPFPSAVTSFMIESLEWINPSDLRAHVIPAVNSWLATPERYLRFKSEGSGSRLLRPLMELAPDGDLEPLVASLSAMLLSPLLQKNAYLSEWDVLSPIDAHADRISGSLAERVLAPVFAQVLRKQPGSDDLRRAVVWSINGLGMKVATTELRDALLASTLHETDKWQALGSLGDSGYDAATANSMVVRGSTSALESWARLWHEPFNQDNALVAGILGQKSARGHRAVALPALYESGVRVFENTWVFLPWQESPQVRWARAAHLAAGRRDRWPVTSSDDSAVAKLVENSYRRVRGIPDEEPWTSSSSSAFRSLSFRRLPWGTLGQWTPLMYYGDERYFPADGCGARIGDYIDNVIYVFSSTLMNDVALWRCSAEDSARRLLLVDRRVGVGRHVWCLLAFTRPGDGTNVHVKFYQLYPRHLDVWDWTLVRHLGFPFSVLNSVLVGLSGHQPKEETPGNTKGITALIVFGLPILVGLIVGALSADPANGVGFCVLTFFTVIFLLNAFEAKKPLKDMEQYSLELMTAVQQSLQTATITMAPAR